MQDRFLARLFWLTLASVLLILLWRGLPDPAWRSHSRPG